MYGLPPGFVRPLKDETGEKKLGGGSYNREKESERLDWDSRWSTPSLSPLNSGDLELDDDQEANESFDDSISSVPDDDPYAAANVNKLLEERAANRDPPHTYAHRREFESLEAKQYWREGWRGDAGAPGVKKTFDLGDASTLGEFLVFACAQGITDEHAPRTHVKLCLAPS